MASEFKVGESVEMRDKGDQTWSKGIIHSVSPLLVRFENGPTPFTFPEVRKLRTGGAHEGAKEEDEIKPDMLGNKMAAPVKTITLARWDPEKHDLWINGDQKIAVINLVLSTIALFIGFAIWTQWGGIAKNIIAAHKNDSNVYSFGYTDKKDHAAAVKLLGPIASISGGTSRVVHAFAVNPCGGRNTNLGSVLCIVIAMFMAGFTLMNDNCSLWLMYFCAILAGIGGGIFSSCMSNLSFFAPDRLQGTFLGICGGFGNLGVATQAQVVPRFAGLGMCIAGGSGSCDALPLGKKYVWNPLCFWGAISLLLIYPIATQMNNMPDHGRKRSKSDPGTLLTSDLTCFATMQTFAYIASMCVASLFYLTNPAVTPMPGLVILRAFLLTTLAGGIVWTMLYGCFLFPHIKERVKLQVDTGLFTDLNTLFMTLLYIMTFGSFIGYANAFPQLITTVFNKDPQAYAWLGATCGSLARVAGGVLSDFMGGAMLTQIAATVQILATLIAGVIIRIAQGSDDNSSIFPWFVFFIVMLFTATGVGNASTFKQMATLEKDEPERRGLLLGFTAAIAAYGAFVIPTIFGAGIKGGFLDVCFYVFAIYYVGCAAMNYMFYLREGCPCPC